MPSFLVEHETLESEPSVAKAQSMKAFYDDAHLEEVRSYHADIVAIGSTYPVLQRRHGSHILEAQYDLSVFVDAECLLKQVDQLGLSLQLLVELDKTKKVHAISLSHFTHLNQQLF